MNNEDNIYSTIQLDRISSTILNAINAQIAIVNADGEVVAFNRDWKFFRDELEEREQWSHPRLDANVLKSLQAPLAEGNDFALRLLLGLKDVLNKEKDSFETVIPIFIRSSKKWFRVTINSLGHNEGAVLIYEDVSSQTQSREYLRETKQKLDKHFENSLYGIIISDKDLNVQEANSTACSMLETSKHDLINANMATFLKLGLDVDGVQKRINREGNFIGERELENASGKKIPVELSVTIYRNEQGKPVISWAFKDISDKKSTEQALKTSMQQYKLQFNNTLEGTIIGRPNGLILEANPAACRILGYTNEELTKLHRNDVFDPSTPLNAAAIKNRRLNNEVRSEAEFTHKDGHKIPVEISSVIFKGEDGTEKSIINIKDISARKAIEKQLKAEKEFTEKAISSLATAFFVINLDGDLIRWNKVLQEDLGYSDIELSSMNATELIHPDDKPEVQNILERDLTGEKVNIEVRCLSKNGDVVHYLVTGNSFSQDGDHYIVGSCLNRNDFKEIETEKIQKEKQLTQLFTNSPIGIVQVKPDGRVIDINESFEKIFGFTRKDLFGKNIDDIIVPEQDKKDKRTLANQHFTGDTFQAEAVRKTKSGLEIPVLIGTVPVKVEGETISMFGMYVEITERKNLEHQILELLETEKKARLHLQELFEESPAGIALLEGENHTYTFANNTYKELVMRSELEGKDVSDALPEIEEQGFLKLLDSCYQDGKTIQFKEKEIYFYNSDQEKSIKYLNLVFKPQKDNSGKTYGVFVEAIDVTEQVKARKLVENSLHEKEILLNEVHHRVKNNLAVISGLIELEMMGSTDEMINKHLYSTQSRISTIAKTHELLYQNESLSHISFSTYIESMMGKSGKLADKNFQKLLGEFKLSDVVLNINQAIPAGMLLNEIIETLNDINQNEFDGQEEHLQLSLDSNCETVCITITDHHHSLISFFEGTYAEKTNLRLELIEVLLKQINGDITFAVSEDEKEHSLMLNFKRSEAKGPHNALLSN